MYMKVDKLVTQLRHDLFPTEFKCGIRIMKTINMLIGQIFGYLN